MSSAREPGGDPAVAEPAPGFIVRLLASIPHLQPIVAGLGPAALADLEASLDWYGVAAGTVLFREGDAAEDAFIVTAGRLGVFIDLGLGPQLVAQIKPGELVGELAMISQEPRSATVIALRDSEVIRMPYAAATRLREASPELTTYLLRVLAARLKATTRRPVLTHATKTIAVVPIDRQPLEPAFGQRLHAQLSALAGKVKSVDVADKDVAPDALGRMEDEHDLVVYVADRRGSPWSGRCLKQADRVLFVATAGTAPDADADRQIAAIRDLHRPADLVLVNPANAVLPTGATAWLGRFAPDHIFHVRSGNAADFARVARLVTGRAIGLVLSGGGARGFAHIGVLRAMHEQRVPIDLIGGASMGALVAGAAAIGRDVEHVGRIIHEAFVRTNPVNDYTLPLFALARGRKMARLLRQQLGDATIENLWCVLFAVSSNLSTGKINVHQQGLLWRAMRATAAIPGIVPPHIERGEVLVDGGVMNNFPADIMSSLARGPVIGVEVTSGTQFVSTAEEIEEKSLFWHIRHGRGAVPNIFRVLMRAGTVSSDAQTVAARSIVDLLIQPELGPIDLLSFDKFDQAVELGYRATLDALQRLDKPLI